MQNFNNNANIAYSNSIGFMRERHMKRAFILLLDSFGIGALPDADKFDNAGANTLMHIAEYCAEGKADINGVRKGPLNLPNLVSLGLGEAAKECNGRIVPGFADFPNPQAMYGYSSEISYGKDTTSGHWEIAGVPSLFDWGYFQKEHPSFPQELVDGLIQQARIPGILGNKHSSGTEIINEFGDEHLRTGKPIVYTSADSVFQIAYHEDANGGLNRLYEICKIARELLAPYNIGRVIARPFTGENGKYERTENRRDFSLPPTSKTLLDKMIESSYSVFGIGKIPDIFAHQGISHEIEAHGHTELFDKTLEAAKNAPNNSLIFTNFVDFDMKFGHRRDVAGYANALEDFDKRLPEIEKILQPSDIVIITADHGCDPTYKGSDHTREYVPVLVFGPSIKPCKIGKRDTLADIAQSLSKYFGLPPFEYGKSFF